jgi:hypothetical protein
MADPDTRRTAHSLSESARKVVERLSAEIWELAEPSFHEHGVSARGPARASPSPDPGEPSRGRSRDSQPPVASTRDSGDTPDIAGATLFAAVLLLLGALLSVIEATLAWSKASYFAQEGVLPVTDLSNWAWVLLLLGLLEFGAAFGVIRGRAGGRWLGIGAASATAIGQLLFLPKRPEWGLVAISFSVLVIWALTRVEPARDITPSR